MRSKVMGLSALLFLCGGTAQGDTILTPFAGGAFGGATDRTRATYGASLAFLGEGVLGFELEFAVTPDFLGRGDPDPVFTTNNVVTAMGSLILASPGGPVRIYGAGGGGLLRTRVADADRLFDVDSNDFGVNVGGGLIGYVGDHVGLRLDIRYFRDLSDDQVGSGVDFALGNLDYWRAVAGIALKF